MAQRTIRSSLRQRMVALDKNFRRELQVVARQTGRDLLNRHREVVKGWKLRPDFSLEVTVQPTRIQILVTPRGRNKKIFRYVNEGTKAHIIQQKNKAYLKFQTGHSPKTKPIAKYNVGNGGRTGGWVSKKQVNHPGTKRRDFTKTFVEEALPELRKQTENAFRRAARSK